MTRYLKQYTYDLPPASFFNASNRGYPDLALAADDIALVFTAFDFLGGGDEGIADSDSSEDSEGSAKSTTTDEKEKKGTSNTATASELGATGVEQRTRGEVIFDGEPVSFAGPLDAREAGIETVFQTLALADDLNVPDNLFLGREKTKFNWLGPFRLLDYKSMREDTMAGLVKTGVKIPNIKNTIANMSGGQRQLLW